MSFLDRIFSRRKWKDEANLHRKNAAKYLKRSEKYLARIHQAQAEWNTERDYWITIGSIARSFLSRRYLKGEGIEIGGLHRPLPVYEGASVRYVDRLPTQALREAYPDLKDQPLVEVDIVDDGEKLETIPDESQDFLIANHMLEHARDPIRTVRNFLRVLKPGGILFMAIPDKRFTFDRYRQITAFEHIKRDYLEGPAWSERAHFEEWVMKVPRGAQAPEPLAEAQVRERADAVIAKGMSIHFHVWTVVEMMEMFLRMGGELGFPINIEAMIQTDDEVVTVVRKTAGGEPAAPVDAQAS
jgi:SAM-dependent methyltransferase